MRALIVHLSDLATSTVSTPPPHPAEKPSARPPAADHHWHLARSDLGVALTDLEYALMRTYESFVRWQAECLQAVTGVQLSGTENALLHVVCMQERPKTIRELMQLTNRQDVPNIQYGLRKLMKCGFVTKSGSGPKGVFYAATAEGLKVCEDYAALREKLLLVNVQGSRDFETVAHAAAHTLEGLERSYESVTREVTAFHRREQTGQASRRDHLIFK